MPFYDFFSDQEYTQLGQRWMKQLARHIIETASQPGSLLNDVVEVGPGWGALANACTARNLNYTSIDANLCLLQRLKPIQSICSFVPPIPVHDESCDVVVASHVLEHSEGVVQARKLVAEMKRIVRPKGCVMIISPDVLWGRRYFWDCDYTHNFPTSSRRLYEMFVDEGLEIVRLEYLYNHLTGWRGSLVGRLISVIPYRFPGAHPNSWRYSERLYRLRMTFSRAVFIIGRRKG